MIKVFVDRFNTAHLVVISIICLTIAGCNTLQDFANSIQKPTLSVANVQVTDFSFEDIELTYDIVIDNPNPLAVQMSSYDYNFKLNDETFIEGQQDDNSEIEASGSSTVKVPVRFDFGEVYRGIGELASADEARYDFLGSVFFNLPVLGITEIPFNRSGTLPMVRIPEIRIRNLQVQNLSLSQADLVLKMEFDNPNTFGIDLNNFNYNLDVNGNSWAEGDALAGTRISGNGTSSLEIPITLNIGEMGLAAYRLLTGSQTINYNLSGTFDLAADHPLLGQTNLNVNRSGSIPLLSGN